jgi:PhnB protein
LGGERVVYPSVAGRFARCDPSRGLEIRAVLNIVATRCRTPGLVFQKSAATQEFGLQGSNAMVSPVPEGYPRISPYLAIDGAAAAIEFYKTVLGGVEKVRMDGPDGRIMHAELQFGDSVLMLADEAPDIDFLGPKRRGGSSVTISLYVHDVDAVAELAEANRATLTRKPSDEFYGDRVASFIDPTGHVWHIATHIRDVTPEEMAAYTGDD